MRRAGHASPGRSGSPSSASWSAAAAPAADGRAAAAASAPAAQPAQQLAVGGQEVDGAGEAVDVVGLGDEPGLAVRDELARARRRHDDRGRAGAGGLEGALEHAVDRREVQDDVGPGVGLGPRGRRRPERQRPGLVWPRDPRQGGVRPAGAGVGLAQREGQDAHGGAGVAGGRRRGDRAERGLVRRGGRDLGDVGVRALGPEHRGELAPHGDERQGEVVREPGGDPVGLPGPHPLVGEVIGEQRAARRGDLGQADRPEPVGGQRDVEALAEDVVEGDGPALGRRLVSATVSSTPSRPARASARRPATSSGSAPGGVGETRQTRTGGLS